MHFLITLFKAVYTENRGSILNCAKRKTLKQVVPDPLPKALRQVCVCVASYKQMACVTIGVARSK